MVSNYSGVNIQVINYGYFNELSVDNSIEPFLEGFELFFDVLVQKMLAVHVHILIFVFLTQFYRIAVLDQLLHYFLPETFDLDVKKQLQLIEGLMSIQDLLHATIKLWFNLVQLFQQLVRIQLKFLLCYQLLIQYFRESNLEMNRVINCQAQQHTHKFEPDWWLKGETIEPVYSAVVFGQEHIEVRVEYLLSQ